MRTAQAIAVASYPLGVDALLEAVPAAHNIAVVRTAIASGHPVKQEPEQAATRTSASFPVKQECEEVHIAAAVSVVALPEEMPVPKTQGMHFSQPVPDWQEWLEGHPVNAVTDVAYCITGCACVKTGAGWPAPAGSGAPGGIVVPGPWSPAAGCRI